MTDREDLARASERDAFMGLMRRGAIRQKLFGMYQTDGWSSVLRELVQMLRVAEREREEDPNADEIARALDDVLRYLLKGYGLGRCSYIPANPIPKGADPDEIEEWEARGGWFSREATVLNPSLTQYFSHLFLSASAKRVPNWCPDHTLAARQRTHRKKDLKSKRSGKYI